MNRKQNDTTLYKQLKYTYFETYNNGKLISEVGNISDGGDQLSVFIDYIGVQYFLFLSLSSVCAMFNSECISIMNKGNEQKMKRPLHMV